MYYAIRSIFGRLDTIFIMFYAVFSGVDTKVHWYILSTQYYQYTVSIPVFILEGSLQHSLRPSHQTECDLALSLDVGEPNPLDVPCEVCRVRASNPTFYPWLLSRLLCRHPVFGILLEELEDEFLA